MKKSRYIIALVVAMFAVGAIIFVACEKEEKDLAAIPNTSRNATEFPKGDEYYFNFYSISDTVNITGDVKSSIIKWHEYSKEKNIFFTCDYTDDTPVDVYEMSDSTLKVVYGKEDPIIMEYTKFSVVGNNVYFSVVYKGRNLGDCHLYYPLDFMANDNAKCPPLVIAAVKYVVIPLAVSVAAGLIVNSCDGDNNSEAERMACINSFRELALNCQNNGGVATIKHHNNHKDCEYKCNH